MSNYEYHKGKLKRVDLSKFENSTEKYFESRYRWEFGISENNPDGLSEWEIQKAYQSSVDDNYRDCGPWQSLWFKDTCYWDSIVIINDDIWEAADIKLNINDDIFTKVSDDEYEYYTSFHNGSSCLSEVLYDGLKRTLNKK